jgi:DNA mismatch repair protein MutH
VTVSLANTRLAPPASEDELLLRAAELAGQTLLQLATQLGSEVPLESRRAKGWAGDLCERALGGTAMSRPLPDFEALGVELKTVPVNRVGRPLESTFVCTIALNDVDRIEWLNSRTRSKLKRVLWLPILAERDIPLSERVIGSAFLWSPSAEEEAALRWDWEELAGLIGCGRIDEVNGYMGKFLQVRPKAARGSSRRKMRSIEGALEEVLPRGFYLRQCFTGMLLEKHLVLPRTEG